MRTIFWGCILFMVGACKKSMLDQYTNFQEGVSIKYEYCDSYKCREIPLKNDSIIHGYLKSFYQNGEINHVVRYENGIKNGSEKHFYPNGKPALELENLNGKTHGIMREYFRNGILKNEYSFFLGKYFGRQTDYNNSGKIETLRFINMDGDLLFKCRLSDNRCTCEGTPVYIAYNKTNLNLNEYVEIVYHFITPPGYSYRLSYTFDEKRYFDVSQKIDSMYYSQRFLLSEKCTLPGKHKFAFALELKDSISGDIITDTTDLKIDVVSHAK